MNKEVNFTSIKNVLKHVVKLPYNKCLKATILNNKIEFDYCKDLEAVSVTFVKDFTKTANDSWSEGNTLCMAAFNITDDIGVMAYISEKNRELSS